MSVDEVVDGDDRKKNRYHFDRHTPEYREQFESVTQELHQKCPIAWSDAYDGHWVASGAREVFELAGTAGLLSSDNDVHDERGGYEHGYKGIAIPGPTPRVQFRAGFIEMDPPEQRYYRQSLNPYLSPAAVSRWVPLVDEVTRACLDEKIETGHIDFVDDLANIVPAVFTLAMMGIPIENWAIYNEPTHASVYTRPNTPEMARVRELQLAMRDDMAIHIAEIRANPRPGLLDALIRADIGGEQPSDVDLLGSVALIIGGGFDTTTALTAHSLEWLSQHPDERARLSAERDSLLDSATEEFLRFFTPAPGNGRTVAQDCEFAGSELKEGDRLWLSWAMANRDPELFPEPNRIDMARKGNRHHSFGLGVHRCIGSNVARVVFKRMLIQVLDRMPDFVCDPVGTVHYDTIGVIQGMRKLPATFTPGRRLGPDLAQTLEVLQRACDEQGLAEPVTRRKAAARIDTDGS